MADQELLDLNLTEDMVQEISAMAFATAQPAAIRFVRRLTRKIYRAKAGPRDLLGVSTTLFSTAEYQFKTDLETAFITFEAAANAASNKAQLGIAWSSYQIVVGLV